MRIMADKLALWQAFLRVLRFNSVSIIPPTVYTHFCIYHRRCIILAIYSFVNNKINHALSYPEDGGSNVLRNTSTRLPTNRMSHCRRHNLVARRHKNPCISRVKIFRTEIYFEAGNNSVKILLLF
jgi:hypothetical protein